MHTTAIKRSHPATLKRLWSALARSVVCATALTLVCLSTPTCAIASSPAVADDNSSGSDATGTASRTVILGAASSLRTVLPDLVTVFTTLHEGAQIDVTFAASGTIRRQVAAGAPIDAVLLADPALVDELISRQLAHADSRRVVAGNQLILAGTKALPDLRFDTLARLPDDALLAIGDPEISPVGRYARTLLQQRGVLDAVTDNLVTAGNVAAVLTYARRGDTEVAIVYATDFPSDPAEDAADHDPSALRVLDRANRPDDPLPQIVAATVRESAGDGALARAFLDWLGTPAARAILGAHGFTVLQQQQ